MIFRCKLCRSDRPGSTYALAENGPYEALTCGDCGLFQVLYDWTASPPPRVTLAYDAPTSEWVFSDADQSAHAAKANDFADRLAATGRLAGAAVLDIGCGHGHFLEACKQRGAKHVAGQEFRQSSIEYARDHCGVHDVRSAPLSDRDVWPDAEFDIVCSFDVAEHVHDLEGFFEECLRVLKPNGFMFHATPGADSASHRLGRLFSRLGALNLAGLLCNVEPVRQPKDLDGGPHVHLMGRRQVEWLADRHALKVRSVYVPSYSYSDEHYAGVIPQLRWMPRAIGALVFKAVRYTVRNKLLFSAART